MFYSSDGKKHTFTIVDAVETLTTIADLDFNENIDIAQLHDFVINRDVVAHKIVHWLNEETFNDTTAIVREAFKVILSHLKNFQKNKSLALTQQKTCDGVNSIMILVGESAKKLDRYTHIFHRTRSDSITHSKEYEHLQHFYKKYIIPSLRSSLKGTIDIHAKIPLDPCSHRTSSHETFFTTLNALKRDSYYELFFMRRVDGTPFFDKNVLRNLKIICDFGENFDDDYDSDPLVSAEVCNDKFLQRSAQCIVQLSYRTLEAFYQYFEQFSSTELIADINKAVIALILAADPDHLLKNNAKKSCHQYFLDFQKYLRDALSSQLYHKLLSYPPKPSSFFTTVMELINTLCTGLYLNSNKDRTIAHALQHIIDSGDALREKKVSSRISLYDRIQHDYECIDSIFDLHPNGSMLKTLDHLEHSDMHHFDTMIHGNIPCKLHEFSQGKRSIEYIQMASPTTQERIHKAAILEEFKTFLRAYSSEPIRKKHLIVNLQNRTTWHEHARCSALEKLQDTTEFSGSLSVVTFAKESDFYYQQGPYTDLTDFSLFIHLFIEQIMSDDCGFFLPDTIKSELSQDVLKEMLHTVHRIFFNGKSMLDRRQRLDFIELFYYFLTLKILEITNADSFSILCKDGVDKSSTANGLFSIMTQLIDRGSLSPATEEHLQAILFGKAFMIRERSLDKERFDRMLSAVKAVEDALYMDCDLKNTLEDAFEHHLGKEWFSLRLHLPH